DHARGRDHDDDARDRRLVFDRPLLPGAAQRAARTPRPGHAGRAGPRGRPGTHPVGHRGAARPRPSLVTSSAARPGARTTMTVNARRIPDDEDVSRGRDDERGDPERDTARRGARAWNGGPGAFGATPGPARRPGRSPLRAPARSLSLPRA